MVDQVPETRTFRGLVAVALAAVVARWLFALVAAIASGLRRRKEEDIDRIDITRREPSMSSLCCETSPMCSGILVLILAWWSFGLGSGVAAARGDRQIEVRAGRVAVRTRPPWRRELGSAQVFERPLAILALQGGNVGVLHRDGERFRLTRITSVTDADLGVVGEMQQALAGTQPSLAQ